MSSSNKHVYNFLIIGQIGKKILLNINGENFSGKSHLINIFIKKFKGVIFNANTFDNDNLSSLNFIENIVLENLNNNINEKLIYSLINTIEQNNKYLIITSHRQ